MSRLSTAALAVTLAAASAIVTAPGALAKDGDLRVKGTCTSAATSKLKLSADDRGIEVEFEVDQNRNGIPWKVTLRRNGTFVSATTATTRAPSGSFSVRRVVRDSPGSMDRIVAVAKSSSGAICRAAASF